MVKFTDKEWQYLHDTDFLLTKRGVGEKLMTILQETERSIAESIRNLLAYPSWFNNPGKISKGENYEGLPFMVLDYPKVNSGEGFVLMRSMIWWGNYCSFTLHAKGVYSEALRAEMTKIWELKDFCICINTDQWNHQFIPSNYILLEDFQENKQLETPKHFLKLAKKYSLEEIHDLPELVSTDFKRVVELF